MSSQESPEKTANDEIPREILELAAAVSELSGQAKETIQPLMERVLDSTKRRRRILALVQDALQALHDRRSLLSVCT